MDFNLTDEGIRKLAEMEGDQTVEAGLPVPRLVKLLECGRRGCGYVLTEDERELLQDPKWASRRTAVCPRCGGDSFYTLNEKGQQLTTRDLEKYRQGINPKLIEPSPRMGPKKRGMILDAKVRAEK